MTTVRPRLRAGLAALPAGGAAGLAALLPAGVRPSVPAWVVGAVLLTALPCLVARSRAWVVGLVGLAVVVGALVPLRLGDPAVRVASLGAAASVLCTAGIVAGRSPRAAGRLDDPATLRLTALGALAGALVLRGLTLLGPSPASGTLPLVGVQVGELTRLLLVGGAALLLADPFARGGRRADGRVVLAGAALAGAGLALLVAVGDLGPAVLVTVAIGAVAVHARGLRARTAALTGVAVLVAVPLLATTSVVRARVGEVVDPGPQLRGALTAAWSGGLVGPGPGRSPLVDGVPAIGSDYAVAALVADLGAVVVVPLLLALLGTEVHLVRRAAAHRGVVASSALAWSVLLAAQGAWSALGALGVLPLTGLDQPFLGVSGASVTTSALAVGAVLGLLERVRPGPPPPGGEVVLRVAGAARAAVAVLVVAATVLLALTPRTLGDAEQVRMPRGTIWTADGEIVAVDRDGERAHPAGGRYADLGYERRGQTHRGVEAVAADTLTCGGELGVLDRVAALVHPVCRPADVVTTVDSRSQAALAASLSGTDGEAVLLDARSGSVAGLWSTASTGPEVPSRARSRQGPPGSTMKIVTASAALLDGVDLAPAPRTVFAAVDGSRLGNDDGTTCPAADVVTALAASCNSVFGWAAAQLGPAELDRVAREYFGADRPVPLDGLEAAGLDTGLPDGDRTADGAVARTGIGQESVRSSVLGTAVATAVVANRSAATPWPHLVAATCTGGPGGPPTVPPAPGVVGTPLPDRVSGPVLDGMRAAVTTGTARRLVVPPGREVVAKTGTAQLADGGTDSWITAVVDARTVLTLVVHHAPEGAAVDAASRVLAALPPSTQAPVACPATETETAP